MNGVRTPFVLFAKKLLVTGVFAVPFMLCLPAQAVEALTQSQWQELSTLSDDGVDGLAFQLLSEAQPSLDENPQAWVEWHKHKIDFLRQQGRWADVVREYENLPANVPQAHADWLFAGLIDAYLAMGAGEQARDLLLPLIWNSEIDQAKLAEWRRLVAKSYLVDGRYDNARTALLRYEQDYPSAELNADFLALKARSLVASEQADKAAILAVVSDEPQVRSAYMLALLKGLTPLDQAVFAEAIKWLKQPQLDRAFKQVLFAALFDKTKQIQEWPVRIKALLQLLELENVEGAQATAVVDALWFALTEYGEQLANRKQLLVGNFGPWFELAEALTQSDSLQAEAVYAWLAVKAPGVDINAKAHQLLVALLEQQGRVQLLRAMYLSSSQFTDVSQLPLAVMYRLIDMALAEGDIGLASKVMSKLDAPEGVNMVEWQLRRARVQILAGAPESGAELLKEIVAADSLSQGQVETVLLAVQDLNNKALAEPAYAILVELLHKAPESSLRAELLYWMGEIRMSQQNYSEAARLYLESARTNAGNAGGWSQAARHRAAHALERAGLVQDALNLYRLLLVNADESEKSVYSFQIRRLLSAAY